MENKSNTIKLRDEIPGKILSEVQDYSIILLDRNGTIESWNAGASIIKGYSENEIKGKSFSIFYNKEENENNLPSRLLSEAIENGHVQQKGWQIKKDNSRFWADVTITAIHDSNNEVIGFSKITRDLSAEKLNEDKLKQLSDRLLLATSASEIGIWDWDLLTNTFIWDEQMYKLYDLEKNTFILNYDSWRNRIHPEDIEMIEDLVKLALTGKNEINMDFRCILPDNSIRFMRMLAKVYSDKEKKATRIIGINMNVTSYKKADEKFKNLLEATPDPMIITNNKGIIEFVNSQAQNLFGYKKSEMIGLPVEIVLPEKFKKAHQHHRDLFFKNPSPRPMGKGRKLFAVTKNGRQFSAEISLSPIETENGILVSATIRDITKREEMEEALRKYTILESKSKEMEQFAYIASHDLREPLLTIKNYIHLIMDKYPELFEKNVTEYLTIISRAANRMENLIKGLLDYSRLSRQKQLQKTDCNRIINEIIMDINALITSTNARINVEPLPSLKVYPLELKLLFQNLIVNAIKFRKRGVDPVITISALKIDNGWQFKVQDNGIGIEEQYKEKIFVIFQKLHNTTEYEGTGIGLAHCRKIAEIHGGSIWVESVFGVSATFYFTILTDNL
jgi:PAS domain S-box-containing protein